MEIQGVYCGKAPKSHRIDRYGNASLMGTRGLGDLS